MHLDIHVSTDPNARSVDTLLQHSSWVRALARKLCADDSSADDLSQDLWVRVLSDARAAPAKPRAWLARVLTNLARESGRGAGARRRREHAVSRGDGVASGDDLIERVELSRRLVEHVLALDEPYRSTILGRYFDERSCEDLARAAGVPSSTVRTRLERGLARLRERLRRDTGNAWLGAALPVLARDAVSSTSLGASTASWIGVVGMSGLKVAVVVACASLGAWWVWSRLEPSDTVVPPPVTRTIEEPVSDALASQPPTAPERITPTITAPPVVSESSLVVAARAGEPSAAEIEALELETPAGVIEGIVLVGREPLTTGGRIVHRPGYFARLPERPEWVGPDSDVRAVPIDARGSFRIVGLELGYHTLAVDRGQGAQHETTVKVEDRPSRRVVIVLGSARVFGCVRDENGVPIAGARVGFDFMSPRRGSQGAFRTARATGADGRYEVRDLPAGTYWITVLRAGAWDSSAEADSQQALELALGEQREFDFGDAGGATHVTGRLLASDGTVLRGPGRLHLLSQPGQALSTVDVDAAGSYDARLQPGTYRVAVSFGTCDDVDRWPAGEWNVTRADSTRDWTIACARFAGVAVDASTGSPWTSKVDVSVYASPVSGGTPSCRATIGPEGRFEILGVRPGVYRVQTHPITIAGGALEITVGDRDVEIPLRLALKRL